MRWSLDANEGAFRSVTLPTNPVPWAETESPREGRGVLLMDLLALRGARLERGRTDLNHAIMGQRETDLGSATRRDHLGNLSPMRRFIPPRTETFACETCADNAIPGGNRQRDRLSPLQMGCQGAVDIQCKRARPTNRANVACNNYLSGSSVTDPIEGENPLGGHRLRLFGADLAGCTAGKNDARNQTQHDLLHEIRRLLKLCCPVQRRKQYTLAMLTPTKQVHARGSIGRWRGPWAGASTAQTKSPDQRPGLFYNWCRKQESNLRPTHYECAALPTELFRPSREL